MAFIFMIFCMLSSSYSYEYLEKKDSSMLARLTKQDKKEILQFLLVLQSSVLFAPPGRRASRHRRYLLNQRSPYFRW